jgi:hypothetical protein
MATLAGSVELDGVLANMAAKRPVFHSEADLQHAFAWEVHTLDPLMRVRLETHPEPNLNLDLLFSRPDLDRHTAVELKYKSDLWVGDVDGEPFALKRHGASDRNCYRIVKDISRLERFTKDRPNWDGVLVTLSNEPSYWTAATHGRETNAAAFRVYEGVQLAGTRAWGPATGASTKKDMEEPIVLVGQHDLRWRDYSRLQGSRGLFRVLVVEVA